VNPMNAHGEYRLHSRGYHATRQNAIIPIVIGALGVGGYYSYRALKRMDQEWEEYQWELRNYEQRSMKYADFVSATSTYTLGIDFGTVFTKMATLSPKVARSASTSQSVPNENAGMIVVAPEVIVNRSGQRAWFNGFVYSSTAGAASARAVESRENSALEQWYFLHHSREQATSEPSKVTLPWNELASILNDGLGDKEGRLTRLLADSWSQSLNDAWETWMISSLQSDESSDHHRIVVSLPVPLHEMISSRAVVDAVADCLGTNAMPPEVHVLPDPVTAIWGARELKLFSADSQESEPGRGSVSPKVLVIDVGGQLTQLAIVSDDIVRSFSLLPYGGETLISHIVDLLRREAKDSHPHELLLDARSMSSLQAHARPVLASFSGAGRSNSIAQVPVHVPYLFSDPASHHLDTVVSRSVWEQAVNHDIRTRFASSDDSTNSIFSQHFPSPTDLSTFWISTLTRLLEKTDGVQGPSDIDYVLLVGGGSKPAVIVRSIEQACEMLMGYSDGRQKLIVPDGSIRSELVVRGAASMLPFYSYDYTKGLYRKD
jgi:hypothetical protein